MIRNLLLPALTAGLAAALLGGCVSDYQYRGGNGDYYYGQPSVEYRDYGYGYGDPYGGGYGGYGYPGGWSGSIGYGVGYGGYGYPYGYGGYGYPYYPGRPPIIVVRPGGHGGHHRGDHDDDDGDHDGDDHDHRPLVPMRHDPDDLRRAQLPGPLHSVQPPRPMLPFPSPRQERMGESRLQPSLPPVMRERDVHRKITP